MRLLHVPDVRAAARPDCYGHLCQGEMLQCLLGAAAGRHILLDGNLTADGEQIELDWLNTEIQGHTDVTMLPGTLDTPITMSSAPFVRLGDNYAVVAAPDFASVRAALEDQTAPWHASAHYHVLIVAPCHMYPLRQYTSQSPRPTHPSLCPLYDEQCPCDVPMWALLPWWADLLARHPSITAISSCDIVSYAQGTTSIDFAGRDVQLFRVPSLSAQTRDAAVTVAAITIDGTGVRCAWEQITPTYAEDAIGPETNADVEQRFTDSLQYAV